MISFYMIGVALVFIVILVVGSFALVYDDNERDVMDLLSSLIIMPWFSWIWLLVILFIMLATYIRTQSLKE